MNRRQFMVELRRYLSFMTSEQRDAVINRYEIIFDAAGPEREREVIDELGSPIKLAIALSREQFKPTSGPAAEETQKDQSEAGISDNEASSGQEIAEEPGYEDSGEMPEQINESALPKESALPEESAQLEAPPSTEEEPAAEPPPVIEPMPDETDLYEPEPLIDSVSEQEYVPDVTFEEEYAENIQDDSVGEPDSGIDEEAVSADMSQIDSVPAAQDSPAEIADPEIIKYVPPEEEQRPRTFLSVLYSVFAIIIGGVASLAAIVICIALFAVPAALLCFGTYLLIAGIGSFGFISDALMILGASGLCLGLGLLAAWFVIWLCIITVRAVITGFSALYSKLFPRGGGIK